MPVSLVSFPVSLGTVFLPGGSNRQGWIPWKGSTLDLAFSSSPATSKSEKSDAEVEVEVLSLLLESAHVYITHV